MPKLQAKVLFDRGLIQFHKKNAEQAAELFREAILEDPSYPEALYNLACCYAMLGEREDCIVYLDRACKLDLQCIEWAKEDPEFDSIRDDEAFIKVMESNDPFKPSEPDNADMLAMIDTGDEKGEEGFEAMDPEQMEHVGEANSDEVPPSEKQTEEIPTCAQCGALVEEMRVQRFNPFVSLAVTAVGVALAIALTWMQYIYSLVLGIPLVAIGLWMFTRVEDMWVCLNCGARGPTAGQPSPESENNNSLENQPTQT